MSFRSTRNEASIARLLAVLTELNRNLNDQLEAVFVVDGSPDHSYALLRDALHKLDFPAQLLAHSRNFGSFSAIRTGLNVARGDFFAVMAADLQEPPELLGSFFDTLSNDQCDVVIGTRARRDDPFIPRLASTVFWWFYKRLVVKEMPEGGVDVFGCNRQFKDQLLKLEESRSSLIALIFWLGFKRKLVSYERVSRKEGKSSWTLSKKLEYMMDSIFAFTDFPIRLLIRIGAIGSIFSLVFGTIVFFARLSGAIDVPGYAATLLVVLILGALNLFALGVVGSYAWRGYENSKQRPLAVVASSINNDNRPNMN